MKPKYYPELVALGTRLAVNPDGSLTANKGNHNACDSKPEAKQRLQQFYPELAQCHNVTKVPYSEDYYVNPGNH